MTDLLMLIALAAGFFVILGGISDHLVTPILRRRNETKRR